METTRYFRAGDQAQADDGANKVIDVSPFIGIWVNTKKDTTGFVKLVISESDGRLALRAFGSSSPELSDWGEVMADVFAENISAHEAMSFSAVYDFGFMETYLQSNLKQGTLVIATCNKFKDDNGRSNYYTREFFYQIDDE